MVKVLCDNIFKAFIMKKEHILSLVSYLAVGTFLALCLFIHLLPALFAGLLVYQLTVSLSQKAQKYTQHCNILASLSIGILVLIVLGLIGLGISHFVTVGAHSEQSGNISPLQSLLDQFTGVLEHSKNFLPTTLADHIPTTVYELKNYLLALFKEHTAEITHFGREGATMIIETIVGMLIGLFIAIHKFQDKSEEKITFHIQKRMHNILEAFYKIVFAQIKIAGINTLLTTIYLAVALPIFGIHLPYTKTLILLTFILGLIPVLGNLLSNFVLIVISLTISPITAIVSLVFLVIIHKLEYFLNAKIVGQEIDSTIWELLLAMFLMEALFGAIGLIAAPVFYAYLKIELKQHNLI